MATRIKVQFDEMTRSCAGVQVASGSGFYGLLQLCGDRLRELLGPAYADEAFSCDCTLRRQFATSRRAASVRRVPLVQWWRCEPPPPGVATRLAPRCVRAHVRSALLCSARRRQVLLGNGAALPHRSANSAL